MNYCSSIIMGWWMTLEKLLDVEVPKRIFTSYCNGISRITDHLICNSILELTQALTLDFFMFSV
jgi:NADH-quinone oxidoreductase subunit D